jgi:EmrB/QacA subfamily drug resistance transporter
MSTITTRRGLALIAMIFAVAMTFIDQTIVSVAAPRIQSELGLSSGGLQWAINSYLLAMAALFAFGGRLADIFGNRRMVSVGVTIFAVASALCGLTPSGGIAQAWLVTCRAVQGIGGALMYPAALAIVVGAYRAEQRGKALALFFGIAGGLTAVGPALGGYLLGWTWRSIFWINIPIAVIALLLVAAAKPANLRRRTPIDIPGSVLITAGVALTVFGLQQSGRWGWNSPSTIGAVVLGLLLLGAFVLVELRTQSPLIDVRIFTNHSFRTNNIVLLVAMVIFVPVFFFASEYGQIALALTPAKASLLLLYFFAGFATAAQFGGRMLDRIGARRPIVLGSVLAAVGLHLWANHVTSLSVSDQVSFIVLTGAGMGLLLGQANTDALNHAPSSSYGEATGIIQTVRNFGSSLGLAVLGSIMVGQLRSRLTDSLVEQGLSVSRAQNDAANIAQLDGGPGTASSIPTFVRIDFAHATSTVLMTMSYVMVAAAVLAWFGLPRRRHANATVNNQPIQVQGGAELDADNLTTTGR